MKKITGWSIHSPNPDFTMHHKSGIIDPRIVFTGSFNCTYTVSRHNQENMLATTNFDIVKQDKDQFEQLWNEMFNW